MQRLEGYMIRKLRKKFVILSTISLLLLLGIIVVSSNFLTYRELVDKADIVLDMIVENGGRPMHLLPPEKGNSAGRHVRRARRILRKKAFVT